MSEQRDTEPSPETEGEGSRTAARHYNEAAKKHAREADPEKEAKEAREAVEDEEGKNLRVAEEVGKSRSRDR